jgi:integrase
MASYQYDAAKGTARIHFRYEGRQLNRVEKVDNERHAQRLVALAEETLIDLARGKLAIPPDVDAKTFILTGGKVEKRAEPVADLLQNAAGPPTIETVFDLYKETLTSGSKEKSSIQTETIHAGNFKRILGADRGFDKLTVDVLQEYVDARLEAGVVRDTIRKELATLRVVWTWAFNRKHILVPITWKIKELTLPKGHEKAPFQTWDQITRKIKRGGLTDAQSAALWECLWLDQSQTVECVTWAREHARCPFIGPMFAFAAYTGARRSEMLRSEWDDWDFDSGIVVLRQKKADNSKEFTRRNVPIHPDLFVIMQEWQDAHPGGKWVMCSEHGEDIKPRMASKYFRATLKGSKWEVLRGWHVFRHSLASNMASAGTDQRIINAILGHHTEEMERRYRHLLPSKQEHALSTLFRSGAAG